MQCSKINHLYILQNLIKNLSMDLRKLASKSFPDISLIALTNASKSQTCTLSNAEDTSSTMGKFFHWLDITSQILGVTTQSKT